MLKSIIVFIISIIGFSGHSLANEAPFDKGYTLPSHYPSAFSNTGILHNVNLSKRTLIIDGSPFKLDLNTPVHLINLPNAILQNLRHGMPIGFSLRKQNGVNLITEIWELPPKAVPLS